MFVEIGIHRFFKTSKPVPLGRWQISNSHTNLKIDLSNEDHCGTCSKYTNGTHFPNQYTPKNK